mmetsp:Transcript_10587/g.16584  ORF Transcript_10587/g.16584 Transcript_10587/m.16584 type:complete len:83 (+) Transcript_10587:620-868(+)
MTGLTTSSNLRYKYPWSPAVWFLRYCDVCYVYHQPISTISIVLSHTAQHAYQKQRRGFTSSLSILSFPQNRELLSFLGSKHK